MKGKNSSSVSGAKKRSASLTSARCSEVDPVRGGARMNTGACSTTSRCAGYSTSSKNQRNCGGASLQRRSQCPARVRRGALGRTWHSGAKMMAFSTTTPTCLTREKPWRRREGRAQQRHVSALQGETPCAASVQPPGAPAWRGLDESTAQRCASTAHAARTTRERLQREPECHVSAPSCFAALHCAEERTLAAMAHGMKQHATSQHLGCGASERHGSWCLAPRCAASKLRRAARRATRRHLMLA